MSEGTDVNILVVDDEQYVCGIIEETLTAEGYRVTALTDPAQALKHLEENPVDLVLTDLVMGEYSGVQIIDTALAEHPDAMVILMTAHPTVQTAISVLKKGAHDFLVKPFKLELLKAAVRRGLQHQRIYRENLRLKEQMQFLRIANVINAVGDIEKYLKMLARCCKQELSADAVGIIEVDRRTRDIVCKVCEIDRDEHVPVVLDEGTLLKFAYTRSSKPIIETRPAADSPRPTRRITISQPIFIRRRFHGVINLLLHRRFGPVTQGQLDLLTILTNSAASAIANSCLYKDLQESYLYAIRALANSIEARDQYTRGHTERVCKIAEQVARRMGWDDSRIRNLIMGCTLHDIGKIGVPDSILNKPGRLSDQERQRMMVHPEVGLQIIKGIDLFKPAVPYIIAHHERYDGSGYPGGLKGEDIPVEGRLLAAVDTLDAILSDRPYRAGAEMEVAVQEIRMNQGTQFDPDIVKVLLEVIRDGVIDFDRMYLQRPKATSQAIPKPEHEKAPA